MSFPFLGFGVGLRTTHYPYILEHWPKVDWFEVLSENYMVPGGRPLHVLDRIVERYPVVLHGVSMSLGSADPISISYLQELKKLILRCRPKWVSDHLCWTGVGGHNLHDLLPLPYTTETVHHVASRIRQVQEELDRQIAIENVSSYMAYKDSHMSEWEFLKAVVEEADCKILLDINNIFVSAHNHTFDPITYLHAIPAERVVQFHLAGHSIKKNFLLDTHDHDIRTEVWDLYKVAIKRFGAVSTLIERDDHIPPFADLLKEVATAKKIYEGNL